MKEFKRLARLAIDANLKGGFVVFFDFAGHVDSVAVRITASKEDNSLVYSSGMIWGDDLNGKNKMPHTKKNYDKAVDILERMIEGEEVFKMVKKHEQYVAESEWEVIENDPQ